MDAKLANISAELLDMIAKALITRIEKSLYTAVYRLAYDFMSSAWNNFLRAHELDFCFLYLFNFIYFSNIMV